MSYFHISLAKHVHSKCHVNGNEKKNELNESISKSKWKTITAKRVEEINEYQGIGKTFGKLDKILCHRYFRAKNCKYETFEERSLVSLLFLKFKSISHWIEIHQVSESVCASEWVCRNRYVLVKPWRKYRWINWKYFILRWERDAHKNFI